MRLRVHTVDCWQCIRVRKRVSSQGNTPSLEIHLAIHSNGARAAGHTATHGPTNRAYAYVLAHWCTHKQRVLLGRLLLLLLLRVTCVLVRTVAIAQANVAAKMCTATATTAAADRQRTYECVWTIKPLQRSHGATATAHKHQAAVTVPQQREHNTNLVHTKMRAFPRACVRACRVRAPPVAAQFNARSPENATPLMPMRMQRAHERARARVQLYLFIFARRAGFIAREQDIRTRTQTHKL